MCDVTNIHCVTSQSTSCLKLQILSPLKHLVEGETQTHGWSSGVLQSAPRVVHQCRFSLLFFFSVDVSPCIETRADFETDLSENCMGYMAILNGGPPPPAAVNSHLINGSYSSLVVKPNMVCPTRMNATIQYNSDPPSRKRYHTAPREKNRVSFTWQNEKFNIKMWIIRQGSLRCDDKTVDENLDKFVAIIKHRR